MLPAIDRAVLTGDIVDSKRLPQEAQAQLADTIALVWEQARRHWGTDTLPAAVDIFRGDSWQCIVRSPARALAVALYLRCRLGLPENSRHGLRTRVSIGLGGIDVGPAGPNRPGVGSAFQVSGTRLDAMPRKRWLAIGVVEDAPAILAPALEGIAVLMDHLAAGWTDNQSRAVAGSIVGRKQHEIAQDWGGRSATQQAVAQALAGAGWDAVDTALRSYAAIFE